MVLEGGCRTDTFACRCPRHDEPLDAHDLERPDPPDPEPCCTCTFCQHCGQFIQAEYFNTHLANHPVYD